MGVPSRIQTIPPRGMRAEKPLVKCSCCSVLFGLTTVTIGQNRLQMDKETKLINDLRVLSGVLGGYGLVLGGLLLVIGSFAGLTPLIGGIIHLLIGGVILVLGRKAALSDGAATQLLAYTSLVLSIAVGCLAIFAVGESLAAFLSLLPIFAFSGMLCLYSFRVLRLKVPPDAAE